jgi:streptogramin lyase
MKTPLRFRLPIVSISFLVSLISGAGHASVAIAEFPIPTADRSPAEIVAASDGNLWFTEDDHDGGIGRITPGGVITEFPLPHSDNNPSLGPITPGSDGALWFRGKDFGTIGRISTSGETTFLALHHGGEINEMTTAADGHIWYSECTAVSRVSPDGAVTRYLLPLPPSSDIESCTIFGWPQGITAGPDGNIWFAVNGLAGPGEGAEGKVGRITPAGNMDFFSDGHSKPGEIVAGPDGNLWFTDFFNAAIGKVTLTGEITEYALSSGSGPNFITAGPDGALWFTQPGSNSIGRISTAGAISEFAVPTPGAQPAGIVAGADGNIWFTESASNKIGRLEVASPCGPAATTLCLGGRFGVTAAWTNGVSSGTGRAAAITANAGYFWFSDPSNLEVLVKILNFCPSAGHFGIYVNGLTHLGVTVTVTDTRTGTSKDYVNADGTPFSLIFDGSTFPCP